MQKYSVARFLDADVDSKDEERPRLFCFSHLRWDFVYQRPQHLISRAATRFRVTFVEEPVFERVAQPMLRIDRKPGGVRVAVPVFPEAFRRDDVQETLRDLIDGLVGAAPTAETVLWYYTPMAMEFTDHLTADAVVYDCMDELSAFRGASAMLRANETRLFQRADLVFCGGASLYQSKRTQHAKAHLFPSSVDRTHFGRAANAADPADQRAIARPRIGFFGVIDERMDLGLIQRLAGLRPDLNFVMLGPVVKIDPASLPRADNLHWLGGKDYKELPDYLGNWDAGFMPFALNESTRFISPTKTPEFLAAGVPVVSTPIADVVRPYGVEGLVEIAATAEDMSAAIDRLRARDEGRWRARVDAKVQSMSWDTTWSAMESLIMAELRSAPAAAGLGKAEALSGV